jgi:DNA gyrase/topoisomerase IV subunit A
LALARGHVSFYGEPSEMLKNSEVLTGDGNSISSNLMASNDGGNIIKEELSSDEQNLEYDITSTTIHQDASDIETSRLPPEEQNEGTISYKTYFKYFTAGGGLIII